MTVQTPFQNENQENIVPTPNWYIDIDKKRNHKHILDTQNSDSIDVEFHICDIICADGKFRIINFYNPGNSVTPDELTLFFSKYTTNKTIVCSDFNAHSPMWGHTKRNRRGIALEECVHKLNLTLLNDGPPTFCNTYTGELSPLDLTFVSPNIALKSLWQSSSVNLGSDHSIVQIAIDVDPTIDGSYERKCIYKRANWAKFSQLCTNNLSNDIVETIYEKAKSAIPTSNQAFRLPLEALLTIPVSRWRQRIHSSQ